MRHNVLQILIINQNLTGQPQFIHQTVVNFGDHIWPHTAIVRPL